MERCSAIFDAPCDQRTHEVCYEVTVFGPATLSDLLLHHGSGSAAALTVASALSPSRYMSVDRSAGPDWVIQWQDDEEISEDGGAGESTARGQDDLVSGYRLPEPIVDTGTKHDTNGTGFKEAVRDTLATIFEEMLRRPNVTEVSTEATEVTEVTSVAETGLEAPYEAGSEPFLEDQLATASTILGPSDDGSPLGPCSTCADSLQWTPMLGSSPGPGGSAKGDLGTSDSQWLVITKTADTHPIYGDPDLTAESSQDALESVNGLELGDYDSAFSSDSGWSAGDNEYRPHRPAEHRFPSFDWLSAPFRAAYDWQMGLLGGFLRRMSTFPSLNWGVPSIRFPLLPSVLRRDERWDRTRADERGQVLQYTDWGEPDSTILQDRAGLPAGTGRSSVVDGLLSALVVLPFALFAAERAVALGEVLGNTTATLWVVDALTQEGGGQVAGAGSRLLRELEILTERCTDGLTDDAEGASRQQQEHATNITTKYLDQSEANASEDADHLAEGSGEEVADEISHQTCPSGSSTVGHLLGTYRSLSGSVAALPDDLTCRPLALCHELRARVDSPADIAAAIAVLSSMGYGGGGGMLLPSFGMLLTGLSFLAFGTFLLLLVQQAIGGGGTGTGGGTGGRRDGGAAEVGLWSELTFLLGSVDEVPELAAEALLSTSRLLVLERSGCVARRLCQLNSRAQQQEVYKGLIYNLVSVGTSLIPTAEVSLWEKLAAVLEARTGGRCEATFSCVDKPG
ncbi:hypothetical protein FJT64_002293 [Amphibalanus amphitrite]|uniref:Uncharacterized protein n=1 Tax=Amphibalanus amphitrite TaxID=1232801 RepID=A0A6A4WYB0_AMPAM|nr:hypothetical protein FJT64_002293 [Amphibalanus amphitrite]